MNIRVGGILTIVSSNIIKKIKLLIFHLIKPFTLIIQKVLAFEKYVKADENYDSYNYVLILGAGIKKGGIPSKVLEDRLKFGISLHNRCNRSFIYVLSGGLGVDNIYEAEVMKEYLIKHSSILSKHIIVDNKGFNTRQSIDNLVKNHIDNVILITNAYHMPRAAYLAKQAQLHYTCELNSDPIYYQYWAVCRREHVAWVKELIISTKNNTATILKSMFRLLSPTALKYLQYLLIVKRLPHPYNPMTFTEKIAFGCVNKEFETYSEYADKVKSREYAKKLLGIKHVVPIYGVASNVDDFLKMDIDGNAFVKPSNSSGRYFAFDPDIMNRASFVRQIQKWQLEDYSKFSLEAQYRNIPFQILIEKDISVDNPYYKILRAFCFKGRIVFFYINDMHGNTWQLSNKLEQLPYQFFKKREAGQFEVPLYWDEMYNAIEKLAAIFEFVRVDMYLCADNYYFSELTFSPHGGVMKIKPKQYDRYLGELFDYDSYSSLQVKVPVS